MDRKCEAKLTTSKIKSLSPVEKPYEVLDTDIKGFLLRVQPSGYMGFYYSYYTTAGKRQRIKIGQFGVLSAAQARDKAIKYAAQVADGIDIQAEKSQNKQAAVDAQKKTLKAFIDDHYKTWALTNQKSGQVTLDSLDYSFSDYYNLPLHEITVSLVDKWRTEKRKNGGKASSINRCTSTLKSALNKAVEWEVISENPLKKLRPLKVDTNPNVRYLTPEEEQRLHSALEARDNDIKQARERTNLHRQERGYELLPSLLECSYGDRMTPLITLSLKTGLRRGEAFDLQWQAVNFDTQTITIHAETSKSNKTRHIPLSPLALETLQNWRKQAPKTDDNRVFPADEEKGGRLDNVRKSWGNILKVAQITNFRWHDMRHDFASQLVMKGVPLNTVRELCGHADLNTTLRYAHLAPDHKAEAVALLG
ncbi:hypothetical protein AB835_11120 [Candidatus Endobugula sertula]|uniref:Integrase n=1 Tax=Candidatus Endobugula sertula TaxID=62101 RepID=A0A1D2QNA7_9GAMM|nr:hypothetical protein AB835_11120 [Candidatus Endobugula sertula]